MQIDLLYFDGCPSWQTGIANLNTALKLEGLAWPIEMVEVIDDEDAERRRFLGSPSFQINGDDLWPQEREVWLTPLSRPRMSKNKVEDNTRLLSRGLRFRQGCGGGQPPQSPATACLW